VRKHSDLAPFHITPHLALHRVLSIIVTITALVGSSRGATRPRNDSIRSAIATAARLLANRRLKLPTFSREELTCLPVVHKRPGTISLVDSPKLPKASHYPPAPPPWTSQRTRISQCKHTYPHTVLSLSNVDSRELECTAVVFFLSSGENSIIALVRDNWSIIVLPRQHPETRRIDAARKLSERRR